VLVLASASPRRQDLLRAAGISCIVQPTNIPEDVRPGESARACAERLAQEKTLFVATQRPGVVVLGADTIVVVDGEMLGKPADAEDAKRMLRMLSAREHEVITGVCLAGPGFIDVRSESTRVTMSALSQQDLDFYVSSGEPMDKAGAYAIQGIASRWIPRIEGDYANVVGLPVALVYLLMREHGVDV
jgi:septum formation protein